MNHWLVIKIIIKYKLVFIINFSFNVVDSILILLIKIRIRISQFHQLTNILKIRNKKNINMTNIKQ